MWKLWCHDRKTNLWESGDKYDHKMRQIFVRVLSSQLKAICPFPNVRLAVIKLLPLPHNSVLLNPLSHTKGVKENMFITNKKIYCLYTYAIYCFSFHFNKRSNIIREMSIYCRNGYPCPVGRVIQSEYDFNSQYTSQVHNTIQQSNVAFGSLSAAQLRW